MRRRQAYLSKHSPSENTICNDREKAAFKEASDKTARLFYGLFKLYKKHSISFLKTRSFLIKKIKARESSVEATLKR